MPNVSQAILKEFAQITTELNNLRESNQNFDELERLKKVSTDYAQARDAVIHNQLIAIESSINNTMRELSFRILKDMTHLPPILRLEKLNKYTFNTPNDGGTGAQYRGLITFDLANMEVTPIPFVVHDSVLLKNIERPVFSEIIRVYDSVKNNGKQVFMAYDTLDSYDDKTRNLIEENAVLKLSPGGNELFGWLGIRRIRMKQANKKKKELNTKFSYNRLWKLLIDRGIKKQELQKMSEVSAASIAKMGRCENVTTDVLLRICESLDCKIENIMERVPIKETAKAE